MHASVIIPYFNAAETIGDLLHSLTKQAWSLSWEVIISDNGSTDDLSSALSSLHPNIPQLRILDAGAKRCASHARNAGVEAAKGNLLLFCDADDVPGPGWSNAMIEALNRDRFVAARLSFDALNPPAMTKARGTTQVDDLQKFDFLPFPHAGGGTLGVRREIHEAVGGFDETIPIGEDIDYCIRVQQMGVPLQFVPQAQVNYRLPSSLRQVYRQARRYAEYEVYLQGRYGQQAQSIELWRWRKYFATWQHVLLRLPNLARSPEGRTQLFWRLGRQIGLLRGSIRFRDYPIITE
ncbi:MAG: glycosyltransferase [Nitrospiraceae bacterium]|nr:glycosyltransferase [Nitrospiraceae bacterium]